jgi:hypothetical protein
VAMKETAYTFKKTSNQKNSILINSKLNTSLFYEVNVELFLLTKTFKEKLVVIFANIRV